MIFLGLKIAASFSRRSSGTFTTPTWSSIPPNPPVSAWPRVSVLKTVVLPDPASPTMAICIGRSYRPRWFRVVASSVALHDSADHDAVHGQDDRLSPVRPGQVDPPHRQYPAAGSTTFRSGSPAA